MEKISQKHQSSDRQRAPRWFTLCLIAATVLMSFAVLEVGSFLYFSTIKSYTSLETIRRYDYDSYRGHRLAPLYQHNGAQHNSQGFRRTGNIDREKPAGTYRIFLVGGSTAYGMPSYGNVFPPYWISNHETIDYYLERFLNQSSRAKRFEVINAAAPGYWTHHHLIYLNQELLDYDPDMIIFLDGHNDHYILNRDHKQFGPTETTEYIERLNRPTLLGVMEHVFHYAASKSWFGFAFKSALNKILSWDKGEVYKQKLVGNLANYETIARRSFLKMIKRNVLVLKDEGIVPVVLLQPELALFQEKHFTPEEKELLKIELSHRQEGYQEKLDIMNQKAARLIQQLAEEYQFLFIDLRKVFDDMNDQAFIDYVHLTPAGGRHLAEFVGERILPVIAAPQ